jgi:tRNA(adenine34) deaminase
LDHVYFMGLALAEAEQGYLELEVPVGAVLVDEHEKILAAAHNSPIAMQDPTAHAEILALRQGARKRGNYRLPGTTMYVTLEPCVMCVGAMLQARIARLVFAAPDPKSGAAGSVLDLTNVSVFNHYIEVVDGVLADESGSLLRRFFRERRHTLKVKQGGEVPKWP